MFYNGSFKEQVRKKVFKYGTLKTQVINGDIRWVAIRTSTIRGLRTPNTTTHEPPSMVEEAIKFEHHNPHTLQVTLLPPISQGNRRLTFHIATKLSEPKKFKGWTLEN